MINTDSSRLMLIFLIPVLFGCFPGEDNEMTLSMFLFELQKRLHIHNHLLLAAATRGRQGRAHNSH